MSEERFELARVTYVSPAPLIVGHFGNKSFQTVDCTGNDS